MPNRMTYLIQLVGLVLVAIGLVLTFKQPAITGLLLGGSLTWTVGRYLRKHNLLWSGPATDRAEERTL